MEGRSGGTQLHVGWKVFLHLSKPQFSSSQSKDNSKPHSSYLMCDNVQGYALLTLKYCIKYTLYHGNIDCSVILDYLREFKISKTLLSCFLFLLIPLWNEAMHKYINNFLLPSSNKWYF